MATATNIEGGCFCGALRYRATAAPRHSMVCHCRSCRGVSGAPMLGWVTFGIDAVEFVRGTPALLHSSPGVERQFCRDCGTPLTWRNPRRSPGEIDITTCSLDEPDAYPPTHHSWVSHDVAWLRLGDGLPQYASTPDGTP